MGCKSDVVERRGCADAGLTTSASPRLEGDTPRHVKAAWLDGPLKTTETFRSATRCTRDLDGSTVVILDGRLQTDYLITCLHAYEMAWQRSLTRSAAISSFVDLLEVPYIVGMLVNSPVKST